MPDRREGSFPQSERTLGNTCTPNTVLRPNPDPEPRVTSISVLLIPPRWVHLPFDDTGLTRPRFTIGRADRRADVPIRQPRNRPLVRSFAGSTALLPLLPVAPAPGSSTARQHRGRSVRMDDISGSCDRQKFSPRRPSPWYRSRPSNSVLPNGLVAATVDCGGVECAVVAAHRAG